MATKKFDRTVWHGTDCDKVTSLFEYGLLVRYITKEKSWQCIYRNPHESNKFSYSWISEEDMREMFLTGWAKNLTVFSFDELSENVQKKIIEREHWNVMEQCMDAYGIDYKKSMKAFEDMTDTRVYNWEVGYERYDFSYEFKYKDPIYEHPTDYHRDIFPENLCGKLLFRYINNNIMPYIIKGKYFSTSGKYIDGKYKYRHKYSRVMFDYGDNCPLTGMCYDYYLLKPIIDYYNAWCTYPEDFSLEDLMRQCYDNFFKSWHEEYEYWADNEDAIREELHHNQYEDQLYYENGDVYVEPLNEIV